MASMNCLSTDSVGWIKMLEYLLFLCVPDGHSMNIRRRGSQKRPFRLTGVWPVLMLLSSRTARFPWNYEADSDNFHSDSFRLCQCVSHIRLYWARKLQFTAESCNGLVLHFSIIELVNSPSLCYGMLGVVSQWALWTLPAEKYFGACNCLLRKPERKAKGCTCAVVKSQTTVVLLYALDTFGCWMCAASSVSVCMVSMICLWTKN